MDISFVQNFISSISGTSFSLTFVVAAIVLSAVYSVVLGKDKILAILFASYTSYALVIIFPYSLWVADMSYSKLVEFKLALFLLSLVIFSFIFIFTHVTRGDLGGFFVFKWIKGVLFGISQLGLLACLTMSLVPADWLYKIPENTQDLFLSPLAIFIWFVAPIIVLIITKKGRRKGPGRPALYE